MEGVDALCARLATSDPSRPVLLDGHERWSASRIERRIARLAGWLAAQGGRGSRVAVWDRKSPVACVLPMAAARAGWVSVPIAPVLRASQVQHILNDSGAALMIAPPGRTAGMAAGAARLVDPAAIDADTDAPLDHALDADPHRLVQLLYTSGSTGRPKGVMLSDANLALGADAVADYLGLVADDVVAGLLPLSFDYGQNQWLAALRAGAAYAPVDYLAAADAVRAVDRVRATVIAGVPTLWRQLVRARWPAETAARVRIVTNSGGALTPELIRALRATFPAAAIVAMYGLTEAFRSTFLAPDRLAAKPRSVGQAIPHAEVLVCRPDGSITADGEPGELVHAGPLVAMGYWNDPAATALRFRPAPAAARSGGLAVWSGDEMVRDADGDLHFLARRDAMMKVAGYRISPAEVEETALATGLAREAVAFSIDDGAGDALIVLAVENDDADAPGRIDAALRRVLPSYQQPARTVMIASMPRTASGKIDRPRVIAMARDLIARSITERAA